MKSSPRRGTEAFDFKEPEENSESAVDKYDGKLKTPSSDDDDALEYEFLGFGTSLSPGDLRCSLLLRLVAWKIRE